MALLAVKPSSRHKFLRMPGRQSLLAYPTGQSVGRRISSRNGEAWLREGEKAMPKFVSPKSYTLDKTGVPTPAIAAAQSMQFQVGAEGLFFVRKHHEQDFFVRFALFNGVVHSADADFAKIVDDTRRMSKLLSDPLTG